jgi:hypothetical protein
MMLKSGDDTEVMDRHFSLQCPHCGDATSTTTISAPKYTTLAKHKPNIIGIGYKCNSCNEPIFLKFRVLRYNLPNGWIELSDDYQTVENAIETFDYEYLSSPVKDDLKEALLCHSIGALNAFAAMCRRTVQSAATELGVKGSDRVKKQLEELKDMAQIDEETYSLLFRIIIDGHDGSHPQLPSLSEERAEILLELMKDVIYQLFVRKAKIEKAAQLRQQQLSNKRSQS